MTLEELDENIIAHRPGITRAQMLKEVLGFGIRRLMVNQLLVRLTLHVRLASQDEYLDRVGGRNRKNTGQQNCQCEKITLYFHGL